MRPANAPGERLSIERVEPKDRVTPSALPASANLRQPPFCALPPRLSGGMPPPEQGRISGKRYISTALVQVG